MTVGTFEIFDIEKRRQLREWHLRGLKNEGVARIVTWTPTIPVTVHAFESLGLAIRGPYHGGVGLLTRDATPYIPYNYSLYKPLQ